MSECSVYVKLSKRLRSTVCLWWVLRHGTVWHLAFPQASSGVFVRPSLFATVYCMLHFLSPSQGNYSKQDYLH